MKDTTKRYITDMCKNHNPIIIVDVFNHLFKYYFANKDLSVVKDGKVYNTGHFYGFMREMLFLREKFPKCSIILAIDGIDLSRREINPDYKSGRVHEFEPMDIMREILMMCSLIDNMYFCYDKDYEADDIVNSVSNIIKTLCDGHKIEKNIYILSSDKDMYQLVSDSGYCKVNSIRKFGVGDNYMSEADFIDESKVAETFNGVKPKDLLKFRALTGDASDNLRGYFRFRKANAAIIAENFEYDSDNNRLVMKNGVEMHSSWEKFLNTVFSDFDVFTRNYKVMQMKKFDFDLIKLTGCYGDSDDSIKDIMNIAYKYDLYSFINGVSRYSPYASIIKSIIDSNDSDEEGFDMPVAIDLGSLL